MAPLPVKRRRRAEGFTLIEVMIAMVLTAIAIMGIIALYVTETKASGFSRHSTEASVLAQDRLEKLRLIGPSPLTTSIVLTSEPNLNERAGTGGIYTRKYSVTVGATYADLYCEVDWSDDGIAHQVIMRGRRGL
ncbi:MAG: prepilin-type N-terminal cleavage/methylation domain-containing protein [Kofleriaceae bacterium]